MKRIVYIHGANASIRSFKYLQRFLPSHDILNISYTVNTPLKTNIENIRLEIIDNFGDKKFSIIGHSLGGVIAIGLHHKIENLDKTLTISAPFGGSKIIKYLKWICPGYQIFADVKPNSPIIEEVKSTALVKPVLSIITSGGGNPLFREDNDGTVSVDSQMALQGPKYIHYDDLSHFEVLLSERVIKNSIDFLF